jgi:hypothetical protein
MMIDAYCSYKGWWGFSGFARILNKGSFGGFGVGFCWAGGRKADNICGGIKQAHQTAGQQSKL